MPKHQPVHRSPLQDIFRVSARPSKSPKAA